MKGMEALFSAFKVNAALFVPAEGTKADAEGASNNVASTEVFIAAILSLTTRLGLADDVVEGGETRYAMVFTFVLPSTDEILEILGRVECHKQPHRLTKMLTVASWLLFISLATVCAFLQALRPHLAIRRDTFAGSLVLIASNRLGHNSERQHHMEESKNVVRWGIVGLGDVTEKKSGPPFWKCEGSELVAVMRRTPGKAADWAKRVPGGNCVGYDSLEEFLKHRPLLDAVYVATRPGSHLEVCSRVAKAGIKNVYVEKPVGRCAQETKAIIDAFDAIGGKVYTAYISRAYPRTQTVRQLLEDGAIGSKIVSVSYTLRGSGGARDIDGPELPWRFDVAQSGGGLIMDVGCHVLDRLDYWFGPLQNVAGRATRQENCTPGIVEDTVVISAEARPNQQEEAISIKCTWDFCSDREEDVLDIVGTGGSIQMEGMSPYGSIRVTPFDGDDPYEKSFAVLEHNGQPMIQALTNAIRGREFAAFVSTGENALRTSKVLDSALASYYGGRNLDYWLSPVPSNASSALSNS